MVKSLTAAEKSGRESRKLHVLGHEKSKNQKIDKYFSSDSLIRIIHVGGKISKKIMSNYGKTPLRNTCQKMKENCCMVCTMQSKIRVCIVSMWKCTQLQNPASDSYPAQKIMQNHYFKSKMWMGFATKYFFSVHVHTCMHASMRDAHACENAESASHPSVLGRTAGPRTAA